MKPDAGTISYGTESAFLNFLISLCSMPNTIWDNAITYHAAEHWGRRHHTYHRTVGGIHIKMRVMKDQRGR
ncbi:hypothetical protein [Candidatus Nitrospira neomarina]|uniref:Uncharacterized protein n=1 Tax=Candidatus Nitrospira neomarina TaxID=3020899 RepID=A0AA96GM95_9BACT|nr:hypothetical protein [Candidatus Nitrospira neomarina]WNM63437.1 hypothetical protein PQG83_06705 [Candidatus Nitrospira neomarina]